MGGPVPICAACIVGLQAAGKNKNKVRAVDNGSWDRLKKNRPKSGLNDPELIEQKHVHFEFWS